MKKWPNRAGLAGIVTLVVAATALAVGLPTELLLVESDDSTVASKSENSQESTVADTTASETISAFGGLGTANPAAINSAPNDDGSDGETAATTTNETQEEDPPNREYQIIYLKYLKAADAAKVLAELFDDADAVRITANERTNALLIATDKEHLQTVTELVEELDRAGIAPTDRTDGDGKSASSPEELRKQYAESNRQAMQYARDLGTGAGDRGRNLARLRREVTRAFESRQNLQMAELAAIRRKLKRVEQQIATREKLKDRIIQRRVEVLQNPDLKWDTASTAAGDGMNSNYAAQPASANSGAYDGGNSSGGAGVGYRPGEATTRVDARPMVNMQINNQVGSFTDLRKAMMDAEQRRDTAATDILVAQSNLKRAESNLQHSRKLAERALVTKEQTSQDEIQVEIARAQLEKAVTQKDRATKDREIAKAAVELQIRMLQIDLDKAKLRYESAKQQHDLTKANYDVGDATQQVLLEKRVAMQEAEVNLKRAELLLATFANLQE